MSMNEPRDARPGGGDSAGAAGAAHSAMDPIVMQRHMVQEAQKDYEKEHEKTTQLVWNKSGDRQALKLREPRQLFCTTGDAVVHASNPRWPVEVPCIATRPHHIHYTPLKRERFYNRKVDDFTYQPSKPYSKAKLVYNNQPGPEPYFVRARAGPSPGRDLKSAAVSPSPESETLVFESRFESGNLQHVYKVGPHDYELYLRTDLYTKKHTQWFYFRVQNTRADTAYRFTIMNLLKPASLYNEGLKPVFYSEKDASTRGVGWVRNGAFISYYKNSVRRLDAPERCCYSMTWTCKLPYANDTCYFAHCYPYTYMDLQEYLRRIAGDPIRSRFCRQKVLCQTIAGNYVHILTITSPSKSPMEAKEKRAIVVTARVHPGETNGSWMMKGFLDFICGSSADAKLLRDCFVFKVIPMLNPDGVIVGNYRCSLAARDLNRNYRSNYKEAYPTIWHCREMVKRLLKERDVLLYCDFHGHSRKNNVFIYGCENKGNPLLRFHERVFPLILDKTCQGKFKFDKCHFRCQKSKEGTGRIVMWRQGILNSFTMEATYCGSKVEGPAIGYHFHSDDLESMGAHFCDAILDYCDPDPSKVQYILEELAERHRQKILQRLQQLGRAVLPGQDLLNMDIDSDLSSDDGGSDSSGSDGEPVVQPTLLKQHVSHRAEKRKRRKARRDKAKAKVKLHFESKRQVHPSSDPAPIKPAHHPLTAAAEPAAATAQPQTQPQELDNGQPSMVPLVEKDIVLKAKSKVDSHLTSSKAGWNGPPPHTQERIDSRSRQVLDMPHLVYPMVAPQPDLNDYLTTITNEYIRQGLLITERTKPEAIPLTYTTPKQRSSQIMRKLMSSDTEMASGSGARQQPPAPPPPPPKPAATTSVIDLPQRAPSPPSFTSQFLANQLKNPLQQSQLGMGHSVTGQFQPVVAPSSFLKSLRHRRGSKSTGALVSQQQQQHQQDTHGGNLSHQVASRYDRAAVEKTMAEHRRNQLSNDLVAGRRSQTMETPITPAPAVLPSIPGRPVPKGEMADYFAPDMPARRPSHISTGDEKPAMTPLCGKKQTSHSDPASAVQALVAKQENHRKGVVAALDARQQQRKQTARTSIGGRSPEKQAVDNRSEFRTAGDVTSNFLTLDADIPESRQGPRPLMPATPARRLRTSEPGNRAPGSVYHKLRNAPMQPIAQDVQPPSSSMQEKGLDAALTPAVVLLDVPSNVTTAVVSNGRSTLSRTPAAAGSLAGHHPLPRVGRTGRTTTTARRTSQ